MVFSHQQRINKLRRWSAIAAIALVVVLVGIFLYRQRQEVLVRKSLPPPVPESVGQLSAGFTFSKMDRGRTLFTVHSSRVTEFKQTKRSLLEDVSIVIFGRDGLRQDRLSSSRCEYLVERGEISCPGSVEILLQSAKEAARAAAGETSPGGWFRITTAAVRFLEDSASGATDEAVNFRFAGGHGRAKGLIYRAREETLRLEHDVEITLERRERGREAPVTLRGTAFEFRHSSNQARIFPPLDVRQANRRMSAGSMVVQLDSRMRPASVLVEGPVTGTAEENGRTMNFRADRITSSFLVGVPSQVAAEGSILFHSSGAGSQLQFGGDRVVAYFDKKGNRVDRIDAEGNVKLKSSARPAGAGATDLRAQERTLEAPGLRLWLEAGPKIRRAETVGPGKLVLIDGKEQRTISGDALTAAFGDAGQVRELRGGPHARLETLEVAGKNRLSRVATSDELTIYWSASGREILRILQKGNFRYRQGEQTAASSSAAYDLRQSTVVLSGSPAVSDRASRTTAEQFTFFQDRNEMQAEGGVQTTYLSRRGGTGFSLPGESAPVQVNAGRMRARAEDGWARYEGRVRLWQGPDAVEADVMDINLKPEARGLVASGDVRSVLSVPTRDKPVTAGGPPARQLQSILRIHSARVKFNAGDNLIRYEGTVEAEGDFGRLTSQALEIRATAPGGRGRATVERIVALRNVQIIQPGRRGKSERAEYFPLDGTIVLSGGTPMLEDEELGTVSGAALTFKNAGASITVESKEGKRTLSRHQLAP